MRRILIVGSQHGNELLGEKLYAYLKEQRSHVIAAVDYVLANPQARERGQRYIESDMNRSYVLNPQSYEQRQAKALMHIIDAGQYDLVLDMHTTTSDQPACFIVADPSKNHAFMALSTISHIVHMRSDMVRRSLIGHSPQAISIEANEKRLPLASLARTIEQYLNNESAVRTKYVYEVTSTITKADTHDAVLSNFVLSSQGFYPVLYGEQSYEAYTDYVGFRADRRYALRMHS